MDMYLHIRVLFTIILGLGVSRLLTGVAEIVQHPTVPVSLPDSFLMVGIPLADSSGMDLSALFFHRDLRYPAISALCAAIPRKNGRLQQL
jgi:hypothetical protein